MRSLSGILLLTVGLTVGAFAYYPGSYDHAADIAELTRMMAPAGRTALAVGEPDRQSRTRLFSPQSPLVALDDPTRLARLDPPAAPVPVAQESWQVVVTVDPAAHAARRRLTSTKPADESSRYQLIRDLQTQLKRVGCYEGEIDGDWGPGSRRAMSSFVERVNASLPTEEPDYILLMLAQGHSDRVCGGGCPSGQATTSDGRCVPRAILARDSTSDRPPVGTSPAQPTTTGHRAVAAAPAQEQQPLARASPTPLDPVAIAPVAPARTAREVASVELPPREPLPGRMTVGGPVTSAPPEPLLKTPPRAATRTKVAAAPAIEPPPAPDAAAVIDDGPLVIKPRDKPRKVARPRTSTQNNAVERRAAPAPKKKYYSSYSGSSGRGAPRPGTPRYNLMLSLGGVF